MRRFDKLFIAVIAVLVALIALTNVFLLRGEQDDRGRPHRVEVNRLAQKIDAGQAPDLGACDYVTGITKYSDNPTGFFNTNSDYVVHQIQGELYRFDYRTAAPKGADFVAVNTALAGMTVVVLGVLVYLRQRILRPFQELSDVPYELSEGNQTLPVKVSGNDYTIKLPATEKANAQDVKASDVTVTVTFRKAQFTLSKAADCENNGTIFVNDTATTETIVD